MDSRSEFRHCMASLAVPRYKINADSLQVVINWPDWDDLYSAGFRAANAGEAYQEWIRCS